MENTIQPEFEATWFHCPHCKYKTEHEWHSLYIPGTVYIPQEIADKLHHKVFLNSTDKHLQPEQSIHISICRHCKDYCVWEQEQLIYPLSRTPITFNTDIPAEILEICEEASSISNLSLRASLLLGRIIIDRLLKEKAKEGTINEMANQLLNESAISFNTHAKITAIRLLGNDINHNDVIDITGISPITIFDLINQIADDLITLPKEFESLQESIKGETPPDRLIHVRND